MFNFKRPTQTKATRNKLMTVLAVAALGLGTVAAAQPALAFGGHGGGGHGGFHGGFFRHGGFHHRHFGFDGGYGDAGYDGYGCTQSVQTAYGYRLVDICE
jgi:hypothetical protein